ncbi:MAG: beta-propeller fold lactonase family protein [Deltaproteobacteria bacterium]|nr:beta-propeller fold lactonase family protein [Deltaproteobacteria bacterium]
MRRFIFLAWLSIIALAHSGVAVAQAQGPRQSTPIALSDDGSRLVNVNPDLDTISIFNVVTPDKLSLPNEVEVGGDPTSVAIHPDNRTAYVANSRDGTVSVVDLMLRRVDAVWNVGAEPMGVVLSPNGNLLYVANAASNTVSVIDTATAMVDATIDLSTHGSSPRAIGVTNDGDTDDSDETVFVGLFFAQLRPGKTAIEEGQDDQREGRVVAVSAATNTVLGATDLGPMASTGFNSNGKLAPGTSLVPAVASTNPQTFTTPTGAFPNQLAAVAIHPSSGRAYVVSTGASPNGPLRFNSMVQGLVSVFDTATRIEVTAAQTDPSVRRTAPLNLNQGINLATTPAPRLFLSNPVAMAWRPDGSDAWVVVQNSDLLVRLTVDGGGIPTINAPLVAGPSSIVRVDLRTQAGLKTVADAPRGLAINSTGSRAYVYNFISRSVSIVNIENATAPAIVASKPAAKLPTINTADATAHLGAALFYTGRGPQERMSSESWGGCITCHPNGRSDNVMWMFDAGPRQTIPLDGMFDKNNPSDQRILNWSAVRDENHDFELNTRGIFGGRGLIDDDRLFLAIGGASGATPDDEALIEQFHQATGAVTETNDLFRNKNLPNRFGRLAARRDFGIATLSDDRVYIIGGRDGAGDGSLVATNNAVLEFNPRTNKITKRSSTGFTPRHSLGAAAVRTSGGFRIYAVGGYGSTDPSTLPVGTVEEYNPDTDTWRTVATLPTATAQFGITMAGGVNTAEPRQLIHVVSGNTGSDAAPSLATPALVQRFQADPAGSGVWSTFTPTGVTARRNHGAATAIRGVSPRIFIIGGQNASGTVLDTVEEYTAQAVTAVLTTHTSLPSPRARFGIGSSLSTNQIYIMGGVDGSSVDQTSIFEYSIGNNGTVAGPTGTPSGTWATRGNLSMPRRSLGVSTPPGVTNFLPVQSAGRDVRQDAISDWIAQSVRASRAPVSASDSDAVSGRTLFGTAGLVVPSFSCATCHGGAKWTRSTVDYVAPPSPDTGLGLGNEKVIGAELRQTATQPNTQAAVALPQFPGVLLNVGTFLANAPGGRVNEIRFNGADISQAVGPLGANGFNIPSLLSAHETAPYFYNGLAQTLEDVLNGSQDANGGTRQHFVTSPTDRAALIAFLRSIDDTTPIFP